MPCKDNSLFVKYYMTFFPPISHIGSDPRPLTSLCPGLGNKEEKKKKKTMMRLCY